MIQLKSVVQQLSPKDFQIIEEQFQKSKANKYLCLFNQLRESELSEEEILGQLTQNKAAYYTLKSRLYDKIQDFLLSNSTDKKVGLIRNVANIEKILFSSPKISAIASLIKMEKKLIEYNMTRELILVYKALRKLHLCTPKYYEFSKLYNKCVAHIITLEKAHDLLSRFTKTTGEYLISRDQDDLEVLTFMQQEMDELSDHHHSHHQTIYRNIMFISYQIYTGISEINEKKYPIPVLLEQSENILSQNSEEASYRHLRPVFDFLAFEYYHKLNDEQNALHYFDRVNSMLGTFLLADHCCLSAHFLISKVERYSKQGLMRTLVSEDQLLTTPISDADEASYIFYVLYKASILFYSAEYTESIHLMEDLLQKLNFTKRLHAEIEVKFLLALSYRLEGKVDQSFLLLKSLARKIKLRKNKEYPQARYFMAFVRAGQKGDFQNLEKKLRQQMDSFAARNKGNYRVLGILNMDEEFIHNYATRLLKVSKNTKTAT